MAIIANDFYFSSIKIHYYKLDLGSMGSPFMITVQRWIEVCVHVCVSVDMCVCLCTKLLKN